MSNALLIMTVGTGTAGKHSDLQAGLVKTIQKIAPRLYWLVPSADQNSLAMADLIREGHSKGFREWQPGQVFCCIPRYDDVFSCRETVRKVIAEARQQIRRGEILVVNPTSGTKQMSVGATLAALDEEIGDLVFTVGERSDGVVKTGTERLVQFSTRAFFRERDRISAALLSKSGAFAAAVRLLERYAGDSETQRDFFVARCRYNWHRLEYAAAAADAARFSQKLSKLLRQLDQNVKNGSLTENILADLLRGADELRVWEENEEAALRYYKAFEYALRIRISLALGGKTTPFLYNDIMQLPISDSVRKNIRRNADGTVTPGLLLFIDILAATNDPLAMEFNRNKKLRDVIWVRNDFVHGIRPVEACESARFCGCLKNLLYKHFPSLSDQIANSQNEVNALVVP